jgi:hypothetical protein
MPKSQRERFEEFMKSPPFERSVARYPDDDEHYAWPTCYIDHDIDLAWEAWQEAARQQEADNLVNQQRGQENDRRT